MTSSGEEASKISIEKAGDKYRSFLDDEAHEISWRYGGPPSYVLTNQLFEEGRTKEWAKGSLEETVQNAIKSWEMEVSHKTSLQDLKSINPDKFQLFVNGREGLSGEEVIKLGTYNALLKTSLPEEFKYYKAEEETFTSSHEAFLSAFPRGFAWEVLSVYSGPPVIAYKFRHWGFFEGPFKGHAPTGEMVEFYGFGTLKEWAKGSLEETVQNAIKSWEMELSHKTRLQDFKTINPDKFQLFVNGRKGLSGEEVLKLGNYNALLKTSLPEEFKYYKAEEETFTSSHDAFRSAFPRRFAWEVLSVYSGPPVIAYKFRHWGFFEGPFKGHAPTGEMVEFYGFGTLKVDESLRAEDVEIYYDPAELFGGLLKGAPITETSKPTTHQACPFSKNVI
ncbi:hypothetical protein EZV62_007997 [Acer yangbiense]|uniref:Pathogen-related protein n=1 Tax=Acer yangbiense TaxID=1000413 RepID=A0A5C7ICZ3_9ROSI|nr:hypothetical protein EZV62_007997 [Acer yangbiense]